MILNGHQIKRNPKKVPYYYQKDAVEATEKSWSEDSWDKSLIVIPTGGGKSFVTGELCAKEIETGGRCLFLAHTKELVTAPRNSFEEDFGCQATIEMAEQKADDSPMVFASVQTMANRIRSGVWRPDTFQRIIFDESHRILAAGHTFVAEHFGRSGAKIAGCTGTPRRGDKKDLLKFFDGISYDIGLERLIDEGFLIQPVFQHEPLNIIVESEVKNGDVKDEELAEAIGPYLSAAADLTVKFGRGRCGLAFLPLRKTAQEFCRLLRERGVRAEYVAGEGGTGGVDVAEQRRIKRRLEMGEIEMAVQAQLWSEGVDIRCLNFMVDLRPTRSWTNFMQKLGRITRTFDPSAAYALKGTRWPRKTDALVLDFCFSTDEHNPFVRPAAIYSKDDAEMEAVDKIIRGKKGGGPVDVLEAVRTARSAQEEALRQRLEAMTARKSRLVNIMDFAIGIHRPELAQDEPLNAMESRPISVLTANQRDWLIRNKFDLDSIKNYGQAKRILDMLGERLKQKKATVAQVAYAKYLGYQDKTGHDPYESGFNELSEWIGHNSPPRPHWMKNKKQNAPIAPTPPYQPTTGDDELP